MAGAYPQQRLSSPLEIQEASVTPAGSNQNH